MGEITKLIDSVEDPAETYVSAKHANRASRLDLRGEETLRRPLRRGLRNPLHLKTHEIDARQIDIIDNAFRFFLVCLLRFAYILANVTCTLPFETVWRI